MDAFPTDAADLYGYSTSSTTNQLAVARKVNRVLRWDLTTAQTKRSNGDATLVLEVWRSGTMTSCIPLDKHLSEIYSALSGASTFGAVEWSPDGTKILIVGEPKPPKTTSWSG